MHKVEISSGITTKVVIDGMDVSDKFDFVSFRQEFGATLPIVTFGLRAQVELGGELLVDIVLPKSADTDLAQLISSLDPAELEASALEMDFTEKNGFTKAILAKILEACNGRN